MVKRRLNLDQDDEESPFKTPKSVKKMRVNPPTTPAKGKSFSSTSSSLKFVFKLPDGEDIAHILQVPT